MECQLCQTKAEVLVLRINKFTAEKIKICRKCNEKAEDNIWSTIWRRKK